MRSSKRVDRFDADSRVVVILQRVHECGPNMLLVGELLQAFQRTRTDTGILVIDESIDQRFFDRLICRLLRQELRLLSAAIPDFSHREAR